MTRRITVRSGSIPRKVVPPASAVSAAGADTDAIHDNAAAEISSITTKGSPADADFLLIEDAADGDAKKKITIGALPSSGTSPLTTKGDVFGYDTSDARVPVGADGQVLTADAAQALGVKWAAGVDAGGSIELFDLLHSTKASSDTPDDEFDSETLDGKWTVVGGATLGTVDLMEAGNVSKYDLVSRPGWLLMQAGANTSQVVSLRQDYTMADAESIVAAVAFSVTDPEGIANNELPIAIGVNDSDVSWYAGLHFHVGLETDATQLNIKSWQRGTAVYGSMANVQIGSVFFLRIVRSGTIFHGFVSTDGSAWVNVGSLNMTAGMPNNLWLFVQPFATNETPVPIIAVKWFRSGTNNLDPWDPTVTVLTA